MSLTHYKTSIQGETNQQACHIDYEISSLNLESLDGLTLVLTMGSAIGRGGVMGIGEGSTSAKGSHLSAPGVLTGLTPLESRLPAASGDRVLDFPASATSRIELAR